jgi:outer membrane protein assembly factor BamB
MFANAIIAVLLFAASGAAQDWPQWRGPKRDGTAVFAKSWPEKLNKSWQIAVGEGHSSPVFSGSVVYVLARQGENEIVRAIQLDSGKVLWQDSYAAPYEMNSAAVSHGKGPKSTPVLADGRLYTYGITGILSSYDIQSGKVRWRKDFAASPLFGTAMSPLVDGGLLVVHTGGHDKGALTAFDASTGTVRWQWNGDGPGYASPITAEIQGTRQIITQTQSKVVGLTPDKGALLWSIPLTTPYVQNIVTPLIYSDLIILSGLQNPAFAIRLKRSGAEWKAERVWENPALSMYMSSPVLASGVLVGFTNRNRGQLFCADPSTGKTLWTGDPRSGENAALLVDGSRVAALLTGGRLLVGAASAKGFEVAHTYEVANSPTWAHPVVTPAGVLIKDKQSLTLWRY